MGTGDPFPGTKVWPGRDADHSPHLVPRLKMSRSYTSSPPSASVACSGTDLALKNFIIQDLSLKVYGYSRFSNDSCLCGLGCSLPCSQKPITVRYRFNSFNTVHTITPYTEVCKFHFSIINPHNLILFKYSLKLRFFSTKCCIHFSYVVMRATRLSLNSTR
jgi:hypothetical protein